MEKIQPVSLSQFTTGELQKTSTHLTSLVEPYIEFHPFIARQVNNLIGAVDILVDIDRTVLASEHTDDIQADDGDIDTLIPMIWDNLKNSVEAKSFFSEKGEASEILIKFFENRDRKELIYGGFTNQGKEITALLKDVFDPSMDANRVASGVEPMLLLLERKFDSLNANLEARLKEGNMPSTQKEQKKILRYRLDNLLTHIDVNIVDGVEGFESLRTPVNELITVIMSEYRARVTRKKSSLENN
jgi:hypothetical protein